MWRRFQIQNFSLKNTNFCCKIFSNVVLVPVLILNFYNFFFYLPKDFINIKFFKLKNLKLLGIFFFVSRLRLLINFIFLFNSENVSYNHCTVKYEIFDFWFFCIFHFNFHCFHYSNRSHGRFVLVFLFIDNQDDMSCKIIAWNMLMILSEPRPRAPSKQPTVQYLNNKYRETKKRAGRYPKLQGDQLYMAMLMDSYIIKQNVFFHIFWPIWIRLFNGTPVKIYLFQTEIYKILWI